VCKFSSCMEDVAAKLEASMQPGQHITSCVWVCYLGEDMCAKCTLGLDHGSKECASTLGYHRDRGDGGNSQGAAPNWTLSVGHPRTLSMQLKLEHPWYGNKLQDHKDAPPLDIPLVAGSIFRLDPQDEVRHPRMVNGESFRGAFYHGMRQGLPAGQISCGFVFRCVQSTRDVACSTRCVIPRMHEVLTRSPLYDMAAESWVQHAPAYAAGIHKQVRTALQKWPWGEGSPPDWVSAHTVLGEASW
jgi:hypothetical protein